MGHVTSRQEQDLIRSYELGTNAYVVKPVQFSDFVVAVKELGVFWALLNGFLDRTWSVG